MSAQLVFTALSADNVWAGVSPIWIYLVYANWAALCNCQITCPSLVLRIATLIMVSSLSMLPWVWWAAGWEMHSSPISTDVHSPGVFMDSSELPPVKMAPTCAQHLDDNARCCWLWQAKVNKINFSLLCQLGRKMPTAFLCTADRRLPL